eukprot:205119_1
MLYKSIRTVALSTFALLITRTFGAEYYVTASSINTANDNLCMNANTNDTCTFLCDVERWGMTHDFDCHKAGTCKLYCGDQKECFKESTINATNSNNDGLYIYATGTGNDCFKLSNIYLPNYGHAIFNSSHNSGNNRFKQMTVHSGINTESIYIDCSGQDEKDECKQLVVNAESAQYLEINIGSGELNGDEKQNMPAIINCPINSTYSGISCIIDASDNGNIELTEINSLNGIGTDLLIKTGNLSIISNVAVSCASGSTFMKNQTLQIDNTCGDILATTDPTISPTNDPIISPIDPTYSPINPTYSPTDSPSVPDLITSSPTISSTPDIVNIDAKWSDSHLKIFVDFIDINDEENIFVFGNTDSCNDIFINAADLFGEDTVCVWNQNHHINIDLSSDSNINLEDVVIISHDAFLYSIDIMTAEKFSVNNDINFTINSADNLLNPMVNIQSIPSKIGICDSLILNSGSIQNLGGRVPLFFEWKIISSIPTNINNDLINNTYYDGFVVIESDKIAINSVITLHLTVINWYNGKTMHTFDVYKSSDVLPMLSLKGPNTYSITNKNYNHDYINIDAEISLDNDCIENGTNNIFLYNLLWSVTTNATRTVLLDKYISDINTKLTDNLIVDTKYLFPGYEYIFNVNLHCIGDLACNSTSASLNVYYEYSPIVCSMYSGEKILHLDFITKSQFISDYILYLDGNTFTYDPHLPMNKSNLIWDWNCLYDNRTCNDLLISSQLSTQSTKFIQFADANISFNVSQTYVYTFSMIVSETHSNRKCIDELTVVVDLLNDTNIHINYLSISIYAISSSINVNDRLRLFIDIYDKYNLTHTEFYEFHWIETIHDIQVDELNINTEENGNLILESNTLSKGFSYQFQVDVTKYSVATNKIIAFGTASITIYVYNGPIIHDSSFIVYPKCNATYLTLSELLTTFHFISIDADGDYL